MSDRQKVLYALLASAFFHLIAGLVLAYWAVDHSHDVAAALPDLEQLEVTIMPAKSAPEPETAAASPAPPAVHRMPRPFIDSDDLNPSKQPPQSHAVFQSDQDMQAASQLPATGNIPLPSNNGREQNFAGYKTQANSFGKGTVPSQAPPSHAAAAPQPYSPVLPEQTPSAISRVQPTTTPAPVAKASNPTPTPMPTPAVKPAADENGYALGKATPTPTPFDTAQLNPSLLRGHADMQPMPREQTQQQNNRNAPEPGVQEGMDESGVRGGIDKSGPNGVDAIETPYGKYMHQIRTMLNSRWRYYVDAQPDLTALGTVSIRFRIAKSGKVTSTRVLSNTSNEGLAALSIKAIMDCTLPPIPEDLAPMLNDDGELEIDNSFILYDPNESPPR